MNLILKNTNMKTWILIIIFSVSINKLAHSCGFYPYGDDVRFSLLKPDYVPVIGFNEFHYTSYKYGSFSNPFDETESPKYDENIQAWYEHFKGEFSFQEIYTLIFEKDCKDLNSKTAFSAFEKALLKPNFKEEFEYFKFAQAISSLNSWTDDPWERKSDKIIKIRKKQIKLALKKSKSLKNQHISRRYAYLALRLAFYNKNHRVLSEIFQSNFENKPKDLLYYWSLHFYSYTLSETAYKYVKIAEVFYNSQEKRFASDLQYYSDFTQEEILNVCKTDEEKTAVRFYYLTKKLDKSLPEIKAFCANESNENKVLYLILRETNKLEDWILTPFYSEFSPSMDGESWNDSLYKIKRSRISLDRNYAKKLAEFVGSISFKDEKNTAWKKSIQAYLLFLADENSNSSKLSISTNDEKLNRFNKMLLALIELKSQASPNLDSKFIQNSIKEEVVQSNYSFLFAVGRELEYAGNTIDAAYMFSHINVSEEDSWNGLFWRSKNLAISTFNNDFFTDYFYYLDAQYSSQQVENLIYDVKNKKYDQVFDVWKKSKIATNLDNMYDLLGTKQLRENKLSEALKAYKMVNDSIWENYPFKDYLDANPFYADFYTEHSKTLGDTIRYTKVKIIEKLIVYLDKINTTEGKNKAYYCFQVANCYLNMTQYGNSWIMKRYYWSSTAQRHRFIDDDEYFQCNLAKKYYLMADESTSNSKISALALRMAGRCEKYSLFDMAIQDEIYEDDYYEKLFYKNQYYKKLKSEFPDDYDPLISNCHSFIEYNKYLR